MSKTVLTQPADRHKATMRWILEDRLGLGPGTGLVVAFGREYRSEAAWLGARARALGSEVGFVALTAASTATGAGLGRRLSRACDALRGGADAVVVLSVRLADSVTFPSGADILQLTPAARGASPLDAWPDPAESAAVVGALKARLDGVARLRLHTLGGVAVFDDAGYGDDGANEGWGPLVPGDPGVLPGSRLQLRVRGADGVFVADGGLRINRPNLFGSALAHRPVRLTFAAGRVSAVHCDDAGLHTFLERAVDVHRLRLVHGLQLAAPAPRESEGGALGALTAAVRIVVEPEYAYSTHSADLTVDLSAASASLDLDARAAVLEGTRAD